MTKQLLILQTAYPLQPTDLPDATRSKQPQIPLLRPSELEVVDFANFDPQQQLPPFAQHIQTRTRSSQNVPFATHVHAIHSKSLS